MSRQIQALVFDNSEIRVGRKFNGELVAKIIDNSIEFPDALHRIYYAYTENNELVASFEDYRLIVLYEQGGES